MSPPSNFAFLRPYFPSRFLCLAFLALAACTSSRIPQTTDQALLICEATSSAMLAQGKGIQLVLLNRETGRAYASKSRAPLSPVSHVTLPAGSYFVVELKLPVGSVTFQNSTKEMAEHFGLIEVKAGRGYYLGSFRGRQKIGLKNIVSLTVVDSIPTQKLVDVLAKDGGAWAVEDLEYVGPSLMAELMVY